MPDRALTVRARTLQGPVSTDDILPARYKHRSAEPSELAEHLFEYARPGFAATIRTGDGLVCRGTLGIGSSREQAVSALCAAGIKVAVATAFGRIFFRNCWNLGLPAIELDLDLAEGARIDIDLSCSCLVVEGRIHSFKPIAPELVAMAAAGGLLVSLRGAEGEGR